MWLKAHLNILFERANDIVKDTRLVLILEYFLDPTPARKGVRHELGGGLRLLPLLLFQLVNYIRSLELKDDQFECISHLNTNVYRE